VAGLANLFSREMDVIELRLVAGLFGTVGRHDSDLRAALNGEMRRSLHAYLKRGVPVVLREEDFSGEFKADLASCCCLGG